MVNTNGAKSIFGAIPGAGGVTGGATGDNELAWWKIIEAAFDYAFNTFPDADLGWVPTLEQAKEIRKNAIAPAVRARDAWRRPGQSPARLARNGIPSNYDAPRIQEMFERWHLYYPFVDQVAVSKALDFHASAWDGLTAREHRAVIRRLATMHDPYEEGNIIYGPPVGTAVKGGKRPVTTTSERASRWMSFPPEERKVLFDLVQRRRRTNDGV